MRKFFTLFVISAVLVLAQSCRKQDIIQVEQPDATNYSSKVANDWMHLYRNVVKSEGKNPPQASRIYAYAAIGLYEAVVPGMKSNKSMEGIVPGLNNLPKLNMFGTLDYTVAANEALYQVALKIFGNLKPENLQQIEALHDKYFKASFQSVTHEVVENSGDFGRMVARAVLDRANNDNFATTRNLVYVVPSPATNPSFWAPTGAATSPAEPFWGNLKCFAMADGAGCTIPSTIPFSTVPGSPFYNQAMEVVTASTNLTNEQKQIAEWWADGAGATSTPPGHWVAIAAQVIEDKNIGLNKAAEVYALLNVGMAEAFISCWNEKYRLNLLRPQTYIRNHVAGQNNWTPYISTPPFPEYPSGHSVASGTASDILTRLLGNVSFTDKSNVNLGLPARTFNSFAEAANEAALSRLYGGIHYREGIDKGLQQGHEVSRVIFDKIKIRK